MKQEKKQESYVKFIRELCEEYVEVEYEENQLETKFCGSLIRFASYTTMVGRCYLFDLMNSIGYENLYYCDTDSCVFKTQGLVGMNRKIGKERG